VDCEVEKPSGGLATARFCFPQARQDLQPDKKMTRATFILSKTVVVVALFTGCQDFSARSVGPTLRFAPKSTISTEPDFDATMVTYNSVACTSGPYSATASCSYDLSNPTLGLRNVSLIAYMDDITYDCVNPKTGKVASSGFAPYGTAVGPFFTTTAATISGANSLLGPPDLPNSYTGKDKKRNACAGTNVVRITDGTMSYWRIYVHNYVEGQDRGDFRWSCYASDDHEGCFTPN
jgi:hypothetical protein